MRMKTLAFAACALAACNPGAPSGQSADNNGGATGSGGGAPAFGQANYRAEMVMFGPSGQEMPSVMYRSGNKTRTEVNAPTGNTIMIMDQQTQEGLMVMNMAGTTIGRRISADDVDPTGVDQFNPATISTAQVTGTCNVAGESGTEYTRTTDAGPVVGCITSDGIMLRTVLSGRTVMEARSIQRGAQNAALFADPPGVTIIDGNDLGAIAAAAARARANSGQ